MTEPKFKTGQVWVHDDLGKFIVLEHSFRGDCWQFRYQGIEGGYDGSSRDMAKFQIGDKAIPALPSWQKFRDEGQTVTIRYVHSNGRIDIYWDSLSLTQYRISPDWFDICELSRIKRILSRYE